MGDGSGRGSGRVGSDFLSAIAGRVGSGQRFAGSGRVGSKKSDPWTTLQQIIEPKIVYRTTRVSFKLLIRHRLCIKFECRSDFITVEL